MTPTPQQLGSVRDGLLIAGFLPYLQQEVAKMCQGVETRMSDAQAKAELTPELALNGWLEVFAARRLLRRFESMVKVGQSQGQRVAPALETY